MKITAVEVLVIFAAKTGAESAEAPSGRRVLTDRYRDGRHICVYPDGEQTALIRLETDEGVVGWGEAHAPYAPSVTQALILDIYAPLILGQDPMASEVLWEKMYSAMRIRGHNTGFSTEALAGVDIALWDLRGKITGQPIFSLLGGPYRRELPVYASGVPGKTDAERQRLAEDYLGQGYTAMKLGIGKDSLEQDIAAVEAVAEVVGDRGHLLVDAYSAYDLSTAIQVGRKLETLGCYWIEDALAPEDHSGYAELARALDMYVTAGETMCNRYQFRDRLATRSVDVITPDICRAGGLSEGHKIAILADLYQTSWAAHVSMGTMVHVAAALHLAAATPNFLICEYQPRPTRIGNNLLLKPLEPVNGYIRVPDGPGLGIAFNEDALSEVVHNSKVRRHLEAI